MTELATASGLSRTQIELSFYLDITERNRAEEDRDRSFQLSQAMLAIASMAGNFVHVQSSLDSCVTAQKWRAFVADR